MYVKCFYWQYWNNIISLLIIIIQSDLDYTQSNTNNIYKFIFETWLYVLTSVYVELIVYLLSSFFYILCWRGRYVEANTAEFDLILPLSLSWCNLCGRNRATGTHISAFSFNQFEFCLWVYFILFHILFNFPIFKINFV